jgi:hypothetical protein
MMTTSDLVYSIDQEIAGFFEKTAATRLECDTFTSERLGGDIVPVAV